MTEERAFAFLPLNEREAKPRRWGITEMRGPYYTPMGPRYLADILETVGAYVDILKFSGGSFSLMPESAVRALVSVAHDHDVRVSTGGFIEWILARGTELVDPYLEECARLGFDIVEISSGFLAVPADDLVALTGRTLEHGLKPKPELNVQFGAGGGSTAVEELESQGTGDVGWAVDLGQAHLDAGAELLMIESEGITENVRTWRTDLVHEFAHGLGLERCVFEAADPEVFAWYIKNYGPEVNLFVDHSQVVQLESLRSGIWGEQSLWGRVVTYRPS